MTHPSHTTATGALSPLLALIVLLLTASPGRALAIGGDPFVRFKMTDGGFPLAVSGKPVPLCASARDYPGVLRVLSLFQNDLDSVCGRRPEICIDVMPEAKAVVLIGTLGKSPLIDSLVRHKKIDVSGIAGKWESYLIVQVSNPAPGIDRALVLVGSDKRGTMYAMFSISERIGMSPWYWWADVPVKHHSDLCITPGSHSDGPPSVKYRGIFLNDEYPALTKWIAAKYGFAKERTDPPVPPDIANYGHAFYQRIFELLLRLKANYLWPAMWNNAFNEDDSLNAKLADEYGIVMGTSHQEPMLRAQKEWDRRYLNSLGAWNYAKYPDTLQKFWRAGIRRNKNYESIITIGLRGANDTPMAPGGPEENMTLLENIIDAQRKILSEEMNPDATKVPQLWCLYKEVLDFYNAGMRVPDDVTLLWPDDNWGNIRRLPTAEERKRSGGAGIYYHFDYHGGPRSYQWINTDPIPKIWEQMSLAKEYGADRIWIVNVGHFKGYELPLEYFMDLAWNTSRWTNDNIDEYTRQWAAREFEPRYATEIADILAEYTRFNGRRKPELLSPTTYSLVNYREAETVVKEFAEITKKAKVISAELPANQKDAFYELVLFPTEASSIVNELYYSAGLNSLYAKQGRASTNDMAERTRALFSSDTSLMGFFNRSLAGGKWDHFMDQTHLGYMNWQDPPTNSLRAIPLAEITIPDRAGMGVAVEGSEAAWPGSEGNAILPVFDQFSSGRHYIEIFNKGKTPFSYSAEADRSWITIDKPKGTIDKQTRIWVSIDWKAVHKNDETGTVTVSGTNEKVTVSVRVSLPPPAVAGSLHGFLEAGGYVSIEAEHYTGRSQPGTVRWIRVQGYGHTLSGMRTTAPIDAATPEPGKNSPSLEYRMYLLDSGSVKVDGYFGPSLNVVPGRGLRYAVSFDDDRPQVISLVPQTFSAQNGNRDWEHLVENNGQISQSIHTLAKAGYHTLKIWMVDPGVVLEKIGVDLGGVRSTYLGPPESYHRMERSK